jgi:hypothetical protein
MLKFFHVIENTDFLIFSSSFFLTSYIYKILYLFPLLFYSWHFSVIENFINIILNGHYSLSPVVIYVITISIYLSIYLSIDRWIDVV